MADKAGFTGRVRRRQTSKLIKLGDVVSRVLITLGGIGTIAAVALVCLFLVWVVVPLFYPAQVEGQIKATPQLADTDKPIHLAVDEYQMLGAVIGSDGALTGFDLASGEALIHQPLVEADGPELTSWATDVRGEQLGLGFANGQIRLGQIKFTTRFLSEDDGSIPTAARKLGPGEKLVVPELDGVISRTVEDQLRLHSLSVELEEPIPAESDAAIQLLDYTMQTAGPVYAALTDDNTLRMRVVRERKNLMTGKVTMTQTGADLPFDPRPEWGRIVDVKLAGLGDSLYVIWEDGHLVRYDVRNVRNPEVAQVVDLIENPEAKLTRASFLLGRSTLIVGDSTGGLSAWFRIRPNEVGKTTDTDQPLLVAADFPGDVIEGLPRPEPAQVPEALRAEHGAEALRVNTAADLSLLVRGHDLPQAGGAIVSMAASARARLLAVGDASGQTHLYHVTSARRLLAMPTDSRESVSLVTISPKDDRLVALTEDRQLSLWKIDVGHPDISFKSIMLPIWYEGYNRPSQVWQSSAGSDDFEPKYGLWPLVFGTLKATVYSMLFGLPIALAAAIYTSEFLHPRLKAKIKPTVEMMASLPSVVLGFLAALIIAPVVEDYVPGMLSLLMTLPFSFLLGAYLMQMLPQGLGLRLARWRFLLILLMLPVGVALGLWVGPIVERLLFAGDVKAWLDGQIGSGVGAWFLLWLPMSAVIVALINSRWTNSIIKSFGTSRSRTQVGALDLAKFLVSCLLTLGVALAASAFLTHVVGWDPRGTYVDTYVQRNALIVGFVMGFAVIPIIYTIAEDAMSAVPEHLRSASLGAGATPWQTAARVVIPTAMSGLFSSVMIGLGRAVGETMIVLMAAGNTPVLEWNIFNGFRTLSANIAVELPEAPQNGTHYRMLFLAALTLFIMTFLVNTVAEVIRLRFRKRAFQL